MEYIELELITNPVSPFREIITEELGEIGFESFVETDNGLLAYIQQSLFNKEALKELYTFSNPECEITYTVKEIPDQNWNAVWESAYNPVLVDDFCYIYAPFHDPDPTIKYNILIEPKMSFGTGHHATTYTMLSYLNTEELEGKKVLDMGCGTAVLAIFATMKGAVKVNAIDNDEWAYSNSLENVQQNNKQNIISVELGDAMVLKNKMFDVIIANINKNILLNDIKTYAQSLNPKGILLMSGFYEHDIADIKAEAQKYNLHFHSYKEKDTWVGVRFVKE